MSLSVCPRCNDPLGPAVGGYCPRCAGRWLLETDASAASDSAGEQGLGLTVGAYHLSGELGRGAMGVVYRAQQPGLKREVAVKVILASRFAGESARKRFLAEAELAAQLDHPNIVPIYEVGETADGPFYAMKLVEGGTLAERMAGEEVGEWESEKTAAIVAKISRAVHHAHQRGVLHRDLKPGNILLDAQGEPYITDFGLARQLGVESSLTLSGSTLGTPAYMSPEQARGEKSVTTASDLWSLGAIFYHLLAGRPPFEGPTAVEVMRKVMEEEPALPTRFRSSRREEAHTENSELRTRSSEQKDQSLLTSAARKIDRDLETICLKCLEKDPARRYTSARALAEDLERWLSHEPILARPTSALERVTKWARRRPAVAALMALAGLLLVIGITGVFWQWRRAEAHAKESGQRLVRMAVTSGLRRVDERDLLGALPWFVEALRLDDSVTSSPRAGFDPNLPASAAARNEKLHRIRFATTLRQAPQLVQLWFPEGELRQADFSPDGSRVVIVSGKTATVLDAVTGRELTPPLAHGRTVTRALFSPDSRRIATVSRDGTARIWNAQTGEPLTGPMLHGKDEELGIDFSPDGNRLLTRGKTVRLWDARTGTTVATEIRHGTAIEMARFTSDGRRIWAASSGTAQFCDVSTGRTSGPAVKIVKGSEFVALSPDAGGILIFRAGAAEILNATNGATLIPPLRHDRSVRRAEFSPDGARVITTALDGTVRIWDAATGQAIVPPIRLSENAQRASFSPDGRWVVTAIEDHSARVWDAARGTPLFSPLWHGHVVTRAVFSPDGRCVLTLSKDGLVRMWNLNPDNSTTVVLAGEGRLRGAWFAHGGRHLLTVENDRIVRVWDSMTGAAIGQPIQTRTDPHGLPFLWAALSPDGTRLAADSSDGAIRIWDVATGRMTRQFGERGRARSVAWRRDGGAVVGTQSRVWNPETGEAVTPPMLHKNLINHSAFSPDGRFVATASYDKTARVWDARTGEPVTPPLQHAGTVHRVWFSPDGRRVASASVDGTARLWNAMTGEQAAPPLRHGGWVTDVAFSPDGRCVVTTSEDGTARLWDAASGRPRSAPLWMRGSVSRPSFSRDGSMLLVGNGYYAQLWDVETGVALSPPLNTVHVGGFDAAFSPDERRVMGITVDRRNEQVDITPIDWPLEDLAAAARLLSCRDMDATGALVPLEQMLEGVAMNAAADGIETARAKGAADDVRPTNEIVRSSTASDGPSSARAVLRRDWERLKPRLTSRSEVTVLQSQIAWHTEQAAAAEVAKQWFAALFHLDRLCSIRTDDVELRQRRNRVRDRLHDGATSARERIPPRDLATPPHLIDLTPFYNLALTNSLHDSSTDNSFSGLCAGVTNLAGVDFDVRGLVQLASRDLIARLVPERVADIKIGRKTARLHFLQTCAWSSPDGTHIGSFMVRYTNGPQGEIPIIYGRDVRDWHSRSGEPTQGANTNIVWSGTNERSTKDGRKIRLFKTAWINPTPDVEIISLEYISKLTGSAPFLFAITADE